MKKISILLGLLIFGLGVRAQNAPEMLENVIGAVVTVAIYETEENMQPMGFRGVADKAYERILDLSDTKTSGSGFVIERNGKKYIITNAHVVENASAKSGALVVYSIDQTKYEVKVVGGDSFYDLAVLEFLSTPGPEITSIYFRAEEARLGEQVYALGNPLGEYPYTVTDGIISAKNRVRGGITGKFGFLQTTATVIWGNSGGPLVDAKGKVLGINSQIAFANRGGKQIWQPQINFALEAGICNRLVKDILENDGLVRRAWLGLEVAQQFDYDSYLAMYGEPWVKRDSLPILKNILPGSPATMALNGYIGASILKVNGVAVRNVQEVLGEFERVKPNSEVSLEVVKQGKKETIRFKSGELSVKNLEDIAKFVVAEHSKGTLTTDGEAVIFKYKQVEEEEETPKKKGNEIEQRERNLRYRGVMEEREQGEAPEEKIIAGGIETSSSSSIWRVDKMSDLGAIFRLSGMAGVFNLYVADEYGGDPEAIPINPSGSSQIFQVTLWY